MRNYLQEVSSQNHAAATAALQAAEKATYAVEDAATANKAEKYTSLVSRYKAQAKMNAEAAKGFAKEAADAATAAKETAAEAFEIAEHAELYEVIEAYAE